jgi:hypothetical protein
MLTLQVAGWARHKMHRDPLIPLKLSEKNRPTILFPLNDYSTTHMVKKSRASWTKYQDEVMADGLPTDIVIPCDSIDFFISLPLLTNFSVMGPTGVGKSTVCSRDLESLFSLTTLFRSQFINILLGKDVMPVGYMNSCTSKLQYKIVDNPPPRKGCRVIIVDTPGFNGTYEDDVEILRRITVWLASS